MEEHVEVKKKGFLSNNKYLITIILIAGLLFYWFQIKPSQIKSDCANSSTENMQSSKMRRSALDWQRSYDLIYENCLHKNGL